jgi:DNA-binding NtrC family response regulator
VRIVVERVLLLTDVGVTRETVGLALPQASAAGAAAARSGSGALADRVDAFERETILAELKRHAYSMTETARTLGLERSHLYKKCQHLGIDVRAVRESR